MITSPTALAAAFPLDVPVGWSDPSDVNMVRAILILGGIPLLLFLTILVAVYLPSLIRGERIAPGQPPVSDHWLGGPRSGTAELEGPGPGTAVDTDAGGASGRW